jgi:hypothetical protein
MKKQLFLRFCILITVILNARISASGQNVENDIKLMFSRHVDGKIATLNAVGQKVFDFSIDGILNKKQADEFAQKFRGKENVVLVNIIEPDENNNQYRGVIVLDKQSKIHNFKELLTDTGFSNIYLDGILVPVEDLEILKSKSSETK